MPLQLPQIIQQPENGIVLPVSGGVSHAPQPAPSTELSLVDYRYHTQTSFMTPISEEDALYPSFHTFQNSIPPTAGTQYLTVDQGTASPKYIRSSMYFVPETENLRAATKLPVAVTIRPFAPLNSTDEPVPVVDFRDLGNISGSDPLDVGPPRCRRCRAYINPSMTFTSVSNFSCNVCQFTRNAVPQEYTSYLDAQGNRADKFVKPELHQGVYDILVPDEYNVGGSGTTNDELHHIFLIDISEPSIRQGLPAVVADSIRTALFSQDNEEPTSGEDETPKKTIKYSIICFDKHVQFYNLSPDLQQTQINVCTDLDDPFVPFFDGLFADKDESRLQIEDALTNLEQMTSDQTFLPDSESCFAVAAKVATMCLESHGGGKITALLAGLPSWGPGGLKFKPNSAGKNADAEKYLFLPNLDSYKQLGKEMVAKSVGLDLFVVAKTQVDLANVGYLCGVTGGNITRWTNFEPERDARAFHGKFVSSVINPRGYQGQLKVRCSNGLQVAQYYGTYSHKDIVGDVMDPKISILTEDQTFTVLFEYDGKLETKYDCHFQVALLYTDVYGARKVRVINLVLAVAEKLQDVFNMVDEDTVVTAIVRDSLSFVGKQSLKDLRESLNNKLVEVYTQYRAMSELGHNITNTMNRTLLFPEALKHLPVYGLSFLKSDALRSGNGITPDSRLVEMFNFMHMPVERLLYNLYPAMVELHSLDDEECTFDDYGFLKMPRFTELSTANMEQGVYILCDGYRVYVWVDPNANILLVKDLFGEEYESVQQLNPMMDELPILPTHISEQSHNLIKFFHSNIIGVPGENVNGIQLVRPGIDGAEITFKLRLVEDNISRSLATPSYADYLTSLHKAIRVNMDSDKASGKIKQSIDNVEASSESLTQRFALF